MKLAVQRDGAVLMKTGTWMLIILLKACFTIFYYSSNNKLCELHLNVFDHVRKLGETLVETG